MISIKGTDCKMLELGRVADETGGQVSAGPGREGNINSVAPGKFE